MKRIAVVTLLVLILSSCWLLFMGDPAPGYEYELSYHVTGTAGSVSLTYYNSGGNIEQHTGVLIPLEINYATYDYWYASILAQNEGSSGSVTVEIYHKDVLIESTTSSGGYVIAMASASL